MEASEAADVGGAIASAIGGYRSTKAQKRIAADSENLSRELAESGIRMRVKDAQLAGINPHAALGMPLASPGVVQVGDAGGGFSELGQSLHRVAESTASKHERIQRARLLDAQITNQELQNDALLTQIVQQSQKGPSLPSPLDQVDPMLGELGQGDGVQVQPAKVVASERGKPFKEAGAISDYGFARTNTGFAVIPSSDVKQRIEDNIIPESLWALRNLILPDSAKQPPRAWLKNFPGAVGWSWNSSAAEWQPTYRNPKTGRATRVKPLSSGAYRR